ncbi:nucleoside triphosphate pyrophosphohydrolase family protein [Luteimonas sp. 22616]|uniref:nucleoside triphosphate pyrophosphohydrolase family protein n=1 Tax=Luteimonas sp. 22616 TaxID=3453951 RepID=UPI003F86E30A
MAKSPIAQGSILLAQYAEQITPTDVLDQADLRSVQHGLFGEVGGIMSAAKKNVRDGKLFPEYHRAAEDEFGDTLWYLAALCRRRGFDLEAIFERAINDSRYGLALAASDLPTGPVASVAVPKTSPELDTALVALGQGAADMLHGEPSMDDVVAFAGKYLDALHATGLAFAPVVQANLRKARGAFLEPNPKDLVDFDADFDKEERLPDEFRIRIDQRASGKSYLQWNGVFIGDPLTDNIADPDGYRFHDVFHLANAAILHWSPVVRALIKHKRKSRPKYDEEQDGGRAIVVEEGLTAWLFARAKSLNYYEDSKRVSLGTLKTAQEFVAGYEVEQCPLKLWERSILQGYAVFRQVRDTKGGWVIGDRTTRTLRYEPLEDAS